MKRFLRWCAFLVLAVIVLIGAGYVVNGLSGHADVEDAKRQAADDVAAALPVAERRAVADRDLARSQADLGAPAYAWQELVCGLSSKDAGWIVQSYTQECQVESVDLYAVAGSTSGGCEPVSLPVSPEPGAVPVSGTRGPAEALASDQPWEHSCPDGLLGPSTFDASRLLRGARPTSLSSSPTWLVITTATPVSSTDLGCDPWKIIFCDAPVDRPSLDGAEG